METANNQINVVMPEGPPIQFMDRNQAQEVLRLVDGLLIDVCMATPVSLVKPIETDLAATMLRNFDKATQKGIKDGLKFLKSKSGELTKADVTGFMNRFERSINIFPQGIQNKVMKTMSVMYDMQRKAFSRRLKVKASFKLIDDRAKKWLAKDTMQWVGGYYGNSIHTVLKKSVTNTMLNQGLDRAEAAQVLQKDLAKQISKGKLAAGAGIPPTGWTGTPKAYFEGLSANAAARASTWSALESMQEGGVEVYRIEAVMDERTSNICRTMNGKEFTVQWGVEQRDKMMAAKTPDEFKSVAGWRRAGAVQSDFGIKPGVPATSAQSKSLAAAGMALPPYHFRCRTVVVPSSSSSWGTTTAKMPKVEPGKPTPQIPIQGRSLTALAENPKLHNPAFVTAIKSDKGLIENQAMRLYTYGSREEGLHTLRFKTTNAGRREFTDRTVDVAKSRVGAPIYHEAILKKGKWELTGDVAASFDDNIVNFKMNKVNGYFSPTKGAEGNLVTMEFKGKLDDALKAFSNTLEDVGLSSARGLPTAADEELLKKARILFQREPEAARAISGATDARGVEIITNTLWDNAVRANPKLKAELNGLVLEDTGQGYLTWRNPAVSKKFEKLDGVFMHNGPASSEFFHGLFNNNGLMSSTARYERGKLISGSSTASDFRTGGADSVFTSFQRGNSRHLVKNEGVIEASRFQAEVNRTAAGRTDVYAYRRDNYGKTHGAHFNNRDTPLGVAERIIKAEPGINEFMFRRGVALDDIDTIWLAPEAFGRAVTAAEKAAKQGIKWRGKHPKEVFKVVPSR